jgi:peptidoglycan endopeptidase LytF
MIGIYKQCKHAALSIALAGGMMGFAGIAQAQESHSQESHSQESHPQIRSAQRELKNDGFYNGTVDGVNGPMTQRAIRQYQRSNNLQANGRLDRQTCNKLGMTGNMGEANRSADENNGAMNNKGQNRWNNDHRAMNENNGNQYSHDRYMNQSRSSSTVEAAQRQLKQKGLYHGAVDGVNGAMTQAAVRRYQQHNNLRVNGELDNQTLNNLGVSTNGSASRSQQ